MKTWKYAVILLCIGVLTSQVIWSKEQRRQNELSPETLKVLEGAEKLEVLSLDPKELEEPDLTALKKVDERTFHNWKILGRTTIVASATRKEFVKSLLEGMQNRKVVAACFAPRHGLHATHAGKTVDLVICFECFRLEAYLSGTEKPDRLLIGKLPEPLLDDLLKKAGIPKAP